MWISKEKYDLLVSNLHRHATQAEMMDQYVKEVKAALDHERVRAENAIDQLLAMKGIAPITSPTFTNLEPADPFTEDMGEVGRWRQMIEKEGLVPAMETAQAEG